MRCITRRWRCWIGRRRWGDEFQQRASEQPRVHSRLGFAARHLVIRPATQLPTGPRFLSPSPLFEEEGNPCLPALIADLQDPGFLNWSRARTALPSDDDPADPGEVDPAERFQERLDGQGPDHHGSNSEMVDSRQSLLPVFDAHAHQMCGSSAANRSFVFSRSRSLSDRLVRTW